MQSAGRPRTVHHNAFAGSATKLHGTALQVSTDANAERVEKLGVGRVTGALLVAIWAGVLVAVIVLRRNTDCAQHQALFWWEAFYRTGSIIFGGGQVRHTPNADLPFESLPCLARLGLSN